MWESIPSRESEMCIKKEFRKYAKDCKIKRKREMKQINELQYEIDTAIYGYICGNLSHG